MPNHIIQRKEEDKEQESIQSNTTSDQGHHNRKWQKHKKTSHTIEPRGQPFPSRWPQGCKEQTRQHNKDKDKTYITKNDPQKKHCLGTVCKKITGGLKYVKGTNLTLNWDVDQDTYIFALHERSLTYWWIIS